MGQCIRIEGSIHFQTQGSNGLPEESQTSCINSIRYFCLVVPCDASGIAMRKRQQSERPGIFLWLFFAILLRL